MGIPELTRKGTRFAGNTVELVLENSSAGSYPGGKGLHAAKQGNDKEI